MNNTFFPTRSRPTYCLIGSVLFGDESSHQDCYHDHQRAKDKRRSWDQLAIDISAQRLVSDQLPIDHAVLVMVDVLNIFIVMLVIEVHMEQIENDAEHSRTQTITEPPHACHHSLDHAC